MPAYPYVSYQNPYQQSFYQPYQQQPIMQPQPVQQQMSQQPQNYSPFVNQSGIIWISGPQEAQMYPIAPNNAVALWEKSGKSIYLKQADATGKPTITVYDLVERKDVNSFSDAPAENTTYATKDDLAAVVGVVKGFDDIIGTLKTDIDTMKGDMYGIAGKKKPAKKAEVEDDE